MATRRVVVTSKLEFGPDDNSLYVGGVGTFISKYSLDTKKLLLTSEKSNDIVYPAYFCNGLLLDKKRQIWVMDGKKVALTLLDHNLVEKRTFQGLSFDRRK